MTESTDTDRAGIPPEVATRLWAEMKSWSSALTQSPSQTGSFRYNMFAQRLQAAEYGRPDAVEWALQWFADLVASQLARDHQDALALEQAICAEQQRAETLRADIRARRSSNPRFEAFLSTLEDPEGELLPPSGGFAGWKYMTWLSATLAKFEQLPDIPYSGARRDELFTGFVQQEAAQQIACREAESSLTPTQRQGA